MSRLETPLRKQLSDGYDDDDVERTWQRVRRRLLRRELAQPDRWRRFWALAAGGAMVALSVALWFSNGKQTASGPLHRTDDPVPMQLGVALEARATAIELSDGSRVLLGPQTHLEVLENSGNAFITALRRGTSTFEVRPGGPRRWVIECGLATIEVVGTAFSVQRTEDTLVVTVERGSVAVRGESVPGRTQRLRAGERIELQDHRTTQDVPLRVAVTASDRSDAGVLLPTAAPAAEGAPRRVAPVPPASATAAPIDELLREADLAQRMGDRRQGAEILQRLLREGRGDPRASFSAFTLARWMTEDDPLRAAAALSELLDAGVPRGLEEDSRARLVDAHRRAGNREAAAKAAADYEQRFPNGARLSEVRRWAEP